MKMIFLFSFFISTISAFGAEAILSLGVREGELIAVSLDAQTGTPPPILYAYPVPETDTRLAKPIALKFVRIVNAPIEGSILYFEQYVNGRMQDDSSYVKVAYKPEKPLPNTAIIVSSIAYQFKVRMADDEAFYKDESALKSSQNKSPAKERGYHLIHLVGEEPFEVKSKKTKVPFFENEKDELVWKYIPQVLSREGIHSYVQVYQDSRCIKVIGSSKYVSYDLEPDVQEEFSRATCGRPEYCVLLADSKLFAKGYFSDNNTCADICKQAQEFPLLTDKPTTKFECKKIVGNEDPVKQGAVVKKDLEPQANSVLDSASAQLREYEVALAKNDDNSIKSAEFLLSVQFNYLRAILPETEFLTKTTRIKIMALSKDTKFLKVAAEAEVQNLLRYIEKTNTNLTARTNDLELSKRSKAELSKYLTQLKQISTDYRLFVKPETLKRVDKVLAETQKHPTASETVKR